jgi:dienelactone hydrolase
MYPHRALAIAIALLFAASIRAQDDTLVDRLRALDARVVVQGKVRMPPLAPMLANDAQAQLRGANERDRKAWDAVRTKAGWEAFRDKRIDALRASLGTYPVPAKDIKARVVRTRLGDGFQIDNIVLESRPGLVVSANLYRPTKPMASMPGMVIVHSHHRPKHVGARQDMAMTWAKAGCLVLVPDLLGHGERRAHPFVTPDDFDQPFRADMQDYWFRYDLGMQLHLLGDSLMGWMAYDLSRCVDFLMTQKGIDAKRMLLVSEPAGGGDVAAVAFALDARFTGGVITNFGGPQPEAPYPLPRDAEQSFPFVGSGSWESTRNLRLSARDGFLPWTIVASVAPRKLIYNHEFYWDRANDPVWKRLQKVYSFYDGANSLTGIAGRGFVVGSEPENWHWLPINRMVLYPTLESWFNIPDPKIEFSARRPEHELLCLSPEVLREFKAQPLHELLTKLGNERVLAARKKLDALKAPERRAQLRKDWAALLGPVEPPALADLDVQNELLFGKRIRMQRIAMTVEPGIVVPMVLLLPTPREKEKMPVVIAVSHAGKQAFVRDRAETIAALLEQRIAVALPDVRGTGETSPGDARDRRSAATAVSATGMMTGETLVGARLRDVRSVIKLVREHADIDAKRIALWGDSFTPPHDADRDLRWPHGLDERPMASEPAGGLLALLAALYEDDVKAVYVQGGLASYASALASPYCYVPHDAIVPGALNAGDLDDVVAALAPRPVRLEGMVDGHNRLVPRLTMEKIYASARTAFAASEADTRLAFAPRPSSPVQFVRWLTNSLRE